MPKGDVETYHIGGIWKNRIEGGEEFAPEYATKEAAVEAGRRVARARRVEHIIRSRDGTIRLRNSYGHDRRDIPG